MISRKVQAVKLMSTLVCLFVITLATWFAAAQENTKAQQDWKEYRYPTHGFSISAPSSPDVSPDPQAADVTLYTWHPAFTVTYQVHVGIRQNCLGVLSQLKESLPKNRNQPLTPGSLKDISLNGNPGLEYEVRTSPGRKAYERLYCAGDRAYSITAWGPLEQPRPAVAVRMFDSFRFLIGNSH